MKYLTPIRGNTQLGCSLDTASTSIVGKLVLVNYQGVTSGNTVTKLLLIHPVLLIYYWKTTMNQIEELSVHCPTTIENLIDAWGFVHDLLTRIWNKKEIWYHACFWEEIFRQPEELEECCSPFALAFWEPKRKISMSSQLRDLEGLGIHI